MCQTLDVVLSWVLEVGQVIIDNTFCLGQSDLQFYQDVNLPEPMRTNAVVEAFV